MNSQPPQVSTWTGARWVFSGVSAPCQSSCSRMWVHAPSRPYVQPWNPQTKDLRALPHAFLAPSGVSTSRRPRCMQTLWWAANSFRPGAHDDDRVVEDVVGQVAADLGDLLDAADLLPHLAPQLVAFGAGVLLGDVGLDADGRRRRRAPRSRRRVSRLAVSMSVITFLLTTDLFAEGFVLEEQRRVVGAQVAPLQVQPAVDEQRLAGDVARQVRQQEQDRAGLFLGRAAPSHRDGVPVPFGVGVDVGRRGGRLGDARRDRVDADAVERQFERHRAGHRDHRRLGRAVGDVERRGVHAADRGDRHDRARACPARGARRRRPGS